MYVCVVDREGKQLRSPAREREAGGGRKELSEHTVDLGRNDGGNAGKNRERWTSGGCLFLRESGIFVKYKHSAYN